MYDRIKDLCSRKGLSIQALEKAAGLSNGSISKWAISTPKADALYRVAEILDTTSDYLLTGTGLRIPGNKKSPAPKEGEAERAEFIRLYEAAPAWLQDQVRSLLKAAESGHAAQGADSKVQ